MRVKRPGVRAREARPSSGAALDWLADTRAVQAGIVYSPRFARIASRCTPREETRDSSLWMMRLLSQGRATLRLASRAPGRDGGIAKGHNRSLAMGQGACEQACYLFHHN